MTAKRRFPWQEVLAVIAFAAMVLLYALVVPGCAVGRELDGEAPMVGVRLDSVGDAASGLSDIGAALFGPPGALIGGGLATVLAAVFGRKYGKSDGRHAGWEEREAEQRERERSVLLSRSGGGVVGSSGSAVDPGAKVI